MGFLSLSCALLQALERILKLFSYKRASLFFALLFLVWYCHQQIDPLEHLFGISHGRLISSGSSEYLVLDNVKVARTSFVLEALTRYSPEVIRAEGYGLWRFLSLFALCWAAWRIVTISFIEFSIHPKIKELSLFKYLWAPATVGAGYVSGGSASALFAISTFLLVPLLLFLSVRQRLKPKAIQKMIAVFDIARLLWFGTLLRAVVEHLTESRLEWFPQDLDRSLVWAFCGLAASLIWTLQGVENKEWRLAPTEMNGLKRALQRSHGLGIAEVVTSLSLWFMVLLWRTDCAYFTTQALAGFWWTRYVFSYLKRRVILHQGVEGTSSRFSFWRIAAISWFIAPLTVLSVEMSPTAIWMGQTAWLLTLTFLMEKGRPWGSVCQPQRLSQSKANRYPRPDFELDMLTEKFSGVQKAAVLLMCLPPEVAAHLFAGLGPQAVQETTLAITQLPSLLPQDRQAVLEEACLLGDCPHSGNWLDRFEKWVRMDRHSVVRLFQCQYLHHPVDIERSLNTPPYRFLTNTQKTAVVLLSVPTNVRESLVSELGTEALLKAEAELDTLPTLTPEEQKLVVDEFLLSYRARHPKESPRWVRHVCNECGSCFEHGIGLRKHQRQTGHEGTQIVRPA